MKLKSVKHTLVHEDQQCSVSDRTINIHSHFLSDSVLSRQEQPVRIFFISRSRRPLAEIYLPFSTKPCPNTTLGTTIEVGYELYPYRQPESSIVINHVLAEWVALTRSVGQGCPLSLGQGCPLSPLLFVLTLEPLLEKIKKETLDKGTYGTGERKL